jgi:hypothetical protein
MAGFVVSGSAHVLLVGNATIFWTGLEHPLTMSLAGGWSNLKVLSSCDREMSS